MAFTQIEYYFSAPGQPHTSPYTSISAVPNEDSRCNVQIGQIVFFQDSTQMIGVVKNVVHYGRSEGPDDSFRLSLWVFLEEITPSDLGKITGMRI